MAYRTRIKYTSAQKEEIWDRWRKGESLTSIGRLFDRPSSSIFNMWRQRVAFAHPHVSDQDRHLPCLNEKKSQGVLWPIYPFAQ